MTSPDHHRSRRQSGTNPAGRAAMTSGERQCRYRSLTESEIRTNVCALEFPGFGADDGALRTSRPAETNPNTRRVVRTVEEVTVRCVNEREVPEQEKKLAVDRSKGALPLTRRCRIGEKREGFESGMTLVEREDSAHCVVSSAGKYRSFPCRFRIRKKKIPRTTFPFAYCVFGRRSTLLPASQRARRPDVTVLAPIARKTPRGLLKNSTGVVLICDKITKECTQLGSFRARDPHFPPSTRLTCTSKSRELAPYRIAIIENGTSLKFATAAVAGAVERSRAVSRVLCDNMSRHDSERAAGNLKIHNHARCSTLVVPCVVNAAQKPAMSNADLEWSGESLDAKALAVVATSALGQLKEKITSTNGTNGPGGVVNNGRCEEREVASERIAAFCASFYVLAQFENWRVRTYFVAEVVPEEILPPLAQSSSGGALDADVASGNGTQEMPVPGRRVTQHWWQLFAPKLVVRKGGLPSNHGPRPRPLSSMPHAVSFALPPAPGGLGRCEPPVNSRDVKRLAGTGQTTPEADENSSRDVRSAEL
ncbi:hypothetical protein H4582DRAFT_2062371 [Lactarius indigo]|nr:hypothetical protein H4582DRAFT_2062371 [Lactarius indigo]